MWTFWFSSTFPGWFRKIHLHQLCMEYFCYFVCIWSQWKLLYDNLTVHVEQFQHPNDIFYRSHSLGHLLLCIFWSVLILNRAHEPIGLRKDSTNCQPCTCSSSIYWCLVEFIMLFSMHCFLQSRSSCSSSDIVINWTITEQFNGEYILST